MAASSMPSTWDEARDRLNISVEKSTELQAMQVEVTDLFFMTPEDLRDLHLSSISRARIAQLKSLPIDIQKNGEKEFSVGLPGVKPFKGDTETYENFIFQLESFVKDPTVRLRVCIAKLVFF